MELIKITEPATIKNYFLKVRELQRSGNSHPVNLDDVFPLIYSDRGKAVRALKANFLENEDFTLVAQNGKNLNGRPKIDYFLTVAAMEFFVAKKVKEVFEVYRQVFHQAVEKVKSPAELFLESAQIQVDHENRLSTIEKALTNIAKAQEQAKEELFALPFPLSNDTIPEISLRDKIRRIVNKLAVKLNIPQNDVWNRVYQELYYSYKISIKACKKVDKKESWLDVAERTGNLDKMYIVVSNIIK